MPSLTRISRRMQRRIAEAAAPLIEPNERVQISLFAQDTAVRGQPLLEHEYEIGVDLARSEFGDRTAFVIWDVTATPYQVVEVITHGGVRATAQEPHLEPLHRRYQRGQAGHRAELPRRDVHREPRRAAEVHRPRSDDRQDQRTSGCMT